MRAAAVAVAAVAPDCLPVNSADLPPFAAAAAAIVVAVVVASAAAPVVAAAVAAVEVLVAVVYSKDLREIFFGLIRCRAEKN